jgi:hypothetical protein
MGLTPKCHFVLRPQVGVPKFPKLGLSWLCRAIILCVDLQLRWGLKQSCSPRRELLAITCVSSTLMGHVSPFYTSTFQELFNGIKNSSIQWVLTPVIALWKFWSPSRLQLPKWELTWECEGSFLHILTHFQEHEIQLLGFPFGPHLYKPLPWSQAQG